MTNAELIKQKEAEVAKLNAEIENLTQEPGGRWKPKNDDLYYYVYSGGVIGNECWGEFSYDSWLLNQGNCFRTKKEAEAYKEYLEAIATIREDAGWWQPDWSDIEQGKWVAIYDYSDNDWHVRVRTVIYHPGTVNFPSEELLEQSLKDHKDAWETVRKWEAGERP